MIKEDDISSTLRLKTEVPRQKISQINRVNLLNQISQNADARLGLVLAPPGFGKTTLLSQWSDLARKQNSAIAWLTMDESDADLRQFLTSLFVSLNRAKALNDNSIKGFRSGFEEMSIDAIIRAMIEALTEFKDQIFIILDDYHRSNSRDIDQLLLKLIRAIPRNIHFIIGTRIRPWINMPQLLVSGLAYEIDADDLRFSVDESKKLVDTNDVNTDIVKLLKHIEGWPVALSFVKLALKGKAVLSPSLKELTTRGSHISNYLAAELVATLTEEQKQFLFETSIVERFDMQLANSIRQKLNGWEIMQQLEPLQSLITHVEGEETWYRYHNLFADFLKNTLEQNDPLYARNLHLRASFAFEKRGYFTEAVKHASEAGDYDRCAELIAAEGGWKMVLYGKRNELANALRQIPADKIMKHPRLIAADAYHKLKTGNLIGASVELDLISDPLRQPREWNSLTEDDHDLFNVSILLLAYEDNLLNKKFIEKCEKQRQLIPHSEPITRSIIECTEAVATLAIGDASSAKLLANDAMQSMKDANTILGLNYCYLHAGSAAILQGNLTTAENLLLHSKTMAEENFGQDSGLKSMSQILWNYQQLITWKNPDRLIYFEDDFKHVAEYDGWFEIYAAALDIKFKTAWIKGDTKSMDETIQIGSEVVKDRNIKRLEIIMTAYALLRDLSVDNRQLARKNAIVLMDKTPLRIWATKPELWRPYQEAAFALYRYYKCSEPDNSRNYCTDIISCAAELNHPVYKMRGLISLAICDSTYNQTIEANYDFDEALQIGIKNKIRLPFIEQPEAELLLKTKIIPDSKLEETNIETYNFVLDLLDEIEHVKQNKMSSNSTTLSPRELEVAREIGRGKTNKEIARTLNLTDHTVKFHLKNIFNKLGVDRRAHVQSLFSNP